MNQVQFYEEISKPSIYIKDAEIDFEILLTNQSIKANRIIVSNTIFKHKLAFQNIEDFELISFQNCKFEKLLTIQDINSNSVSNQTITFNSCEFNELELTNIKGNYSPQIQLIDSKADSFLLRKCELDNLLLNSGKFLNIWLENNHINSLRFLHMKSEYISSNGLYGKFISFSNIDPIDNSPNTIILNNIHAEGSVLFDQITANRSMHITPGEINDLGLYNCTGLGTCTIDLIRSDSKIKNMEMNYTGFKQGLLCNSLETIFNYPAIQIDSLSIYVDPLYNGNLHLDKLNINNCEISGTNANAKIQLTDCRFEIIGLIDFVNNSDFFLSNISSFTKHSPNSKFGIVNSKMGKAHFFNVDLNSFNNFIYHDSDILEIGISHVTWFNGKKMSKKLLPGNKLSPREKEAKRDEFKRLRDLFRQLKMIMERHGDKAYALEFFRWEMWNYNQIVKLKGSLADRIILMFGQSNNFGTNWVKPLFILLLSSFICYIPIALIIQKATTSKNALCSIQDNLYIWIHMLNPAHAMDRLLPDGEKTNWQIYAFDMLDRILVSIFIYQIIIAFRKYFRN